MKHKILATICAMLFALVTFAQTDTEGDALTAYIGKEAGSLEVKNLIGTYKCETANPIRCISRSGVELIFNKNLLSQINLYDISTSYGSYKGKLPKGLKFGMSPSEVKALLGKPVVSYQSGYSEFNMRGYSISCWFDGTKLTQVSISEPPTSL